ncbi:hypothetical protein [Novipirellula sp.]
MSARDIVEPETVALFMQFFDRFHTAFLSAAFLLRATIHVNRQA